MAGLHRLFVVLALAACAHPRAATTPRPAASSCLDLPGTARASLRAGPDGKTLYWVERVTRYGYHEAYPTERLVRWSGEGEPATIAEGMRVPYRVLDDGRVVALSGDGILLWDRGEVALISGGAAEVEHLSLVGDDLVYQAGGALYLQPLRREVARRLAPSDELEGTSGRTAYARRGTSLVAIDVDTGAEQARRVPAGEIARVEDGAVFVHRDDGVAMLARDALQPKVVLDGEDWLSRSAPDGLQAMRPTEGRVEVALVTGAGVTTLPPVVGARHVETFATLADGRVAYLVGHDTDRDDDVDWDDEMDVCLAAPGATELAVTARRTPRRLAGVARAIDRIVATRLAGGSWRAAGGTELPAIVFTSPTALTDTAAALALAHALAADLSAATGDPAINVELFDGDRRRFSSDWRAWPRRRQGYIGIGGLTYAVLADAAVVLSDVTLTAGADGALTCAGTLTNQSERPLVDVTVVCDDDAAPIATTPSRVEPGATARWSGPSTGTAGAPVDAVVYTDGGHEVAHSLDREGVERYRKAVTIADEIRDRTRLYVYDWKVDGDTVVVEAEGPGDFGGYSHAAQLSAFDQALELLRQSGPALFDAPAAARVHLRVWSQGRSWYGDGREVFAE